MNQTSVWARISADYSLPAEVDILRREAIYCQMVGELVNCPHNGVYVGVDNCPLCGVKVVTFFDTHEQIWRTAESVDVVN